MRLILSCLLFVFTIEAQVRFDSAQWTTNRELVLRLVEAGSPYLTIERSSDLVAWEPLATIQSVPSNNFTNTGASYRHAEYYRAVEVNGTNVLTGDYITTTNGPITIHPVNHASFVVNWNGLTLYNVPWAALPPIPVCRGRT
jgi:hypothetical protein